MPLTLFQIEVMSVIVKNRRPESHLAGGVVLNRHASSPRFSDDFDIFHDLDGGVPSCAEEDERTLNESGYEFRWEIREPKFRRAVVSKGEDSLRLDWAWDADFRFFPIQPDPLFGFRLHDADAATNKAIAPANRREARDYIDVLHIDINYLSLGALIWAACGKDEGYTPALMLEMMSRNSKYRQADFDDENLTSPVDLATMKVHWLGASERATQLFDTLPIDQLGTLYLDENDKPLTPDPKSENFTRLKKHKGCNSGALPTISG